MTERSSPRPVMPAITPETKRTWSYRRVDHSAGGVAWRALIGSDAALPAADRLEVALIATRDGTRWQLPKGTCEPGESAEETALREVEEEVGLQTTIEAFLRTVEYWYWDTWQREHAVLVQKRVDFYLQRATGGELSDTSIEVDATGWFTFQQASEMLTFAGEREVIADAIRYFEGR